ncbi:MAG: sulfite exporter TauE/SafE family protein [Alphaproteobacteria bacterium]|nr:sulfite exporter TauE/SafE family protein [Alphaproteobacteria bacterium]
MNDFVDLMAAEAARPGFAWVALAMLVTGVVRGLVGFGAAMILVPILAVVMGPTMAVPLLTVIDGLATLPLFVAATRQCRWREIVPLTIAAVAALPAGIATLVYIEPETLRLGISVTILLLVAVIASGWRYHGSPSLPLTLGVGASSGALGGATGMIGPPVILFWLGGQNDAALVRANINAFFGLMIVATAIAYWIGGLLTQEVLAASLLLAPIYGVAVWAGARGFRHTSDVLYRRFAFALITMIAFSSLFL